MIFKDIYMYEEPCTPPLQSDNTGFAGQDLGSTLYQAEDGTIVLVI